jgi:hypothetical protein
VAGAGRSIGARLRACIHGFIAGIVGPVILVRIIARIYRTHSGISGAAILVRAIADLGCGHASVFGRGVSVRVVPGVHRGDVETRVIALRRVRIVLDYRYRRNASIFARQRIRPGRAGIWSRAS